MKGHQYRKTS